MCRYNYREARKMLKAGGVILIADVDISTTVGDRLVEEGVADFWPETSLNFATYQKAEVDR